MKITYAYIMKTIKVQMVKARQWWKNEFLIHETTVYYCTLTVYI